MIGLWQLSLYFAVMIILVGSIFFSGWFNFREYWPRTFLGIIGMSCFVLMHVYSLRRRKKTMKIWNYWTQKISIFLNIHILLATTGLVFILFHTRFTIHNANAWISFGAMMIVWTSGFFGRFIYTNAVKKIDANTTRGQHLRGILAGWHTLHLTLSILFYTTALSHIVIVSWFSRYAK